MSFFSDFVDKVKEKKAELDDRREFQKMVDEQAKPIRRAAYMKEMIAQSVNEGIAKAKIDAAKRIPKEKPKPEDFGIKSENKDPWAYLDKIGMVEESRKGPDFSIPKFTTKSQTKKK